MAKGRFNEWGDKTIKILGGDCNVRYGSRRNLMAFFEPLTFSLNHSRPYNITYEFHSVEIELSEFFTDSLKLRAALAKLILPQENSVVVSQSSILIPSATQRIESIRTVSKYLPIQLGVLDLVQTDYRVSQMSVATFPGIDKDKIPTQINFKKIAKFFPAMDSITKLPTKDFMEVSILSGIEMVFTPNSKSQNKNFFPRIFLHNGRKNEAFQGGIKYIIKDMNNRGRPEYKDYERMKMCLMASDKISLGEMTTMIKDKKFLWLRIMSSAIRQITTNVQSLKLPEQFLPKGDHNPLPNPDKPWTTPYPNT